VGLHPFLDHPTTLAFAHRGGASDHPENTLPAFASAVAMGYRYLETDVHLTADGTLVAFHDDRLDRVTDGCGAIADLPWAEVRQARVDGREPIPTLDDLFEAFPGARLNIDPKHDRAVDPLAHAVRRHRATDRVCVASFSDDRLRRLRAALGGLCTALGPRQVARLRLGGPLGMARDFAGQAAQVPPTVGGVPLVTARFVARAHGAGLQVHVWTIDDPVEMHRLLDLDVDGLMTDRPAVLKQVLEDRGRWSDAGG
jgi:glycerophosphoryl diester phosphodiesterase